ncbi:hypothetical protein FACS1894132_04220 [Clostridia bacterium]|nr:hypothetical protein FACS1894132_04220 [Clostridia bacterium]
MLTVGFTLSTINSSTVDAQIDRKKSHKNQILSRRHLLAFTKKFNAQIDCKVYCYLVDECTKGKNLGYKTIKQGNRLTE